MDVEPGDEKGVLIGIDRGVAEGRGGALGVGLEMERGTIVGMSRR